MSMLSSRITKKPPRPPFLFVAAIDFGTTYSGYAFSSKDSWETVRTNKWTGGNLMSEKAPTVVLLNPDQSFNSFGYTAENEYSELAKLPGKKYRDYYYFNNFKMKLHVSKNVTDGSVVEDVTGKPMQAFLVFAHAIRELKKLLLAQLKNAITGAKDEDVLFVLTVPAIWDERAKLFMRKAAIKAGIHPDLLVVALEPEAASVFCQTLPFNVEDIGQSQLAKPGVQYMVADLGGGTADLTVHRRTQNNKLQELWRASGGPWGGKAVTDKFQRFVEEIVGATAMRSFIDEEMEDYLELLRDFEVKKRQVKINKPSITINIPVSINEVMKENSAYKDFETATKSSKYSSDLEFRRNKLTLNENMTMQLFEPIVREIMKKMDDVFEHVSSEIPYILLVGGFSECEIVRQRIKEHFESKTVIAPHDSGLIVLKGAVYFGYLPEAISIRCAPYTFGMQSWPPFDPRLHPSNKRVIINGKVRCKDVFHKFVTIGDPIEPGCSKSQAFQVLDTKQSFLECVVYISEEDDPKFVDDCTPLITLNIPLENFRNREIVEIEETLVFGETELRITAIDIKTGVEYTVSKELTTRY